MDQGLVQIQQQNLLAFAIGVLLFLEVEGGHWLDVLLLLSHLQVSRYLEMLLAVLDVSPEVLVIDLVVRDKAVPASESARTCGHPPGLILVVIDPINNLIHIRLVLRGLVDGRVLQLSVGGLVLGEVEVREIGLELGLVVDFRNQVGVG